MTLGPHGVTWRPMMEKKMKFVRRILGLAQLERQGQSVADSISHLTEKTETALAGMDRVEETLGNLEKIVINGARSAALDGTKTAFVKAAYQSILGRNVDPGGLENYRGAISGDAIEAGMSRVMSSLIGCGEARLSLNRFVARDLRQIEGRDAPDRPGFRHVASLGWNCMPSALLKKHDLKRYSLPFDWIFGGLDVVDHAIDDDFRTFLDKSNFVRIPVETRRNKSLEQCEHLFYRERFGVKSMFNHFDPTAPETHEYMKRAVSRFRALLASGESKLFLLTLRPADYDSEKVHSLHARLQKRTKNFHLLVVISDVAPQGAIVPSIEFMHRSRGLEIARLRSLSGEHDAKFVQFLDESIFLRLIYQYRLDLAPSITNG